MIPAGPPPEDDEPREWLKLEGAVAMQTLVNATGIMLRRQGDEAIIRREEIAGKLIECYVTVFLHVERGDIKLKFNDPASMWRRATPGIEPGNA